MNESWTNRPPRPLGLSSSLTSLPFEDDDDDNNKNDKNHDDINHAVEKRMNIHEDDWNIKTMTKSSIIITSDSGSRNIKNTSTRDKATSSSNGSTNNKKVTNNSIIKSKTGNSVFDLPNSQRYDRTVTSQTSFLNLQHDLQQHEKNSSFHSSVTAVITNNTKNNEKNSNRTITSSNYGHKNSPSHPRNPNTSIIPHYSHQQEQTGQQKQNTIQDIEVTNVHYTKSNEDSGYRNKSKNSDLREAISTTGRSNETKPLEIQLSPQVNEKTTKTEYKIQNSFSSSSTENSSATIPSTSSQTLPTAIVTKETTSPTIPATQTRKAAIVTKLAMANESSVNITKTTNSYNSFNNYNIDKINIINNSKSYNNNSRNDVFHKYSHQQQPQLQNLDFSKNKGEVTSLYCGNINNPSSILLSPPMAPPTHISMKSLFESSKSPITPKIQNTRDPRTVSTIGTNRYSKSGNHTSTRSQIPQENSHIVRNTTLLSRLDSNHDSVQPIPFSPFEDSEEDQDSTDEHEEINESKEQNKYESSTENDGSIVNTVRIVEDETSIFSIVSDVDEYQPYDVINAVSTSNEPKINGSNCQIDDFRTSHIKEESLAKNLNDSSKHDSNNDSDCNSDRICNNNRTSDTNATNTDSNNNNKNNKSDNYKENNENLLTRRKVRFCEDIVFRDDGIVLYDDGIISHVAATTTPPSHRRESLSARERQRRHRRQRRRYKTNKNVLWWSQQELASIKKHCKRSAYLSRVVTLAAPTIAMLNQAAAKEDDDTIITYESLSSTESSSSSSSLSLSSTTVSTFMSKQLMSPVSRYLQSYYDAYIQVMDPKSRNETGRALTKLERFEDLVSGLVKGYRGLESYEPTIRMCRNRNRTETIRAIVKYYQQHRRFYQEDSDLDQSQYTAPLELHSSTSTLLYNRLSQLVRAYSQSRTAACRYWSSMIGIVEELSMNSEENTLHLNDTKSNKNANRRTVRVNNTNNNINNSNNNINNSNHNKNKNNNTSFTNPAPPNNSCNIATTCNPITNIVDLPPDFAITEGIITETRASESVGQSKNGSIMPIRNITIVTMAMTSTVPFEI